MEYSFLENIDLNDLEAFRAVAREGGVIRAAEQLHRVPSAVTARIKKLEESVGKELFVREPRGMRPTEAGEVLLNYANQMLDLRASALSAIRGGAPSGILRLGSMESTAAMRLAGPLSAYAEAYSDVELRLQVAPPEKLLTELRAGRLEAIFLAGEFDGEAFEAESVFSEKMVLVSPASSDAEWPDTLLVFGQDCPNRARLYDWYTNEGIRPKRTIELGSYLAMLGSIAIGVGSGVMPEGMLSTYPEKYRLRSRPLPKPFDVLETRLVWRKGAKSSRVSALLQVLETGD